MDFELSEPFRVMFRVMKVFGMWQDGNQSWAYFLYGYFLNFMFVIIYLISQFIYAYNAVGLDDLIDAMGLTTTYIAMMFKCFNFFSKVKSVVQSYDSLETLLEFSSHEGLKTRDRLKKEVKIAYKVFKWFWMSAFFTCSSAFLVTVFAHQLPYKVWFPFDTNYNGAGFWVASMYLIFNSYVVSSLDINLDCLPAIFMSFAVGLLGELCDRLKSIGTKDKTNEDQEVELIKCIEIHKRIKQYVHDIESNFATVLFAQGLMSSLILCTSAFTLSLTKEPSVFFRLGSFIIPMVLEIFVPCYFGNEVSVASAKLSTAVFQSNWADSSVELKKAISIFMENTKKDLKISAFGIMDANLATFGSIGNSAYKLFAVLQSMNN